MRKWEIRHDYDLENGTPTEWALKISEEKLCTITQTAHDTFDVAIFDICSGLINELKQDCRSLASAKKWVSRNVDLGHGMTHPQNRVEAGA